MRIRFLASIAVTLPLEGGIKDSIFIIPVNIRAPDVPFSWSIVAVRYIFILLNRAALFLSLSLALPVTITVSCFAPVSFAATVSPFFFSIYQAVPACSTGHATRSLLLVSSFFASPILLLLLPLKSPALLTGAKQDRRPVINAPSSSLRPPTIPTYSSRRILRPLFHGGG